MATSARANAEYRIRDLVEHAENAVDVEQWQEATACALVAIALVLDRVTNHGLTLDVRPEVPGL